jgi:hypothetical protein
MMKKTSSVRQPYHRLGDRRDNTIEMQLVHLVFATWSCTLGRVSVVCKSLCLNNYKLSPKITASRRRYSPVATLVEDSYK